MTPFPNNTPPDNSAPLLLHCCCGPCAAGSIAPVLETKRGLTLLFSNSNLDTESEYLRRLDALKTLADYYGLRVETDPWDHEGWLKFVSVVPASIQHHINGELVLPCRERMKSRRF